MISDAWSSHVSTVLVQYNSHDLTCRITLVREASVDDLVEEIILGAGIDRNGRLARELCRKLLAAESNVQNTAKRKLVPAHVIMKRGEIERDLFRLRRKLRGT